MFRNLSYYQSKTYYQIGEMWLELSNQSGNALPVISEKLITHVSGTKVNYWQVEIFLSADYSPFGVKIFKRSLIKNGVTDFTSFGFQNQEEDLKSGLVNYKYRMHNPSIGRFCSVYPLAANHTHNCQYAFSENRVIDGIELEGQLKFAGYE